MFGFAPHMYPTYVSCFTERVQFVHERKANNIEVFKCRECSVIPNALLCDGKVDCMSSEDELQCSICSEHSFRGCLDRCIFPVCQCNMFYYQCQGGGCLHYDHVCDIIADCPHGDDESGCHQMKRFHNFDAVYLKKARFIGLCDPPVGDLLMCRSVSQCYNSSAICHYEHSGGVMTHCEDALCKKASNHHANLPLEMYSFTL